MLDEGVRSRKKTEKNRKHTMVASIPNDIFQFSTWAAVHKGFNTGQPRVADLTSHGTDGIGVFEDGKLMALIDAKAYAIAQDGDVSRAQLHERLCYAMVTIFQPMRIAKFQGSDLTMKMLKELLSSVDALPGVGGGNSLLPFKIKGTFVGLDLETPLSSPNSREGVKGTVFGYKVPLWMEGISGPALHCHFLSEDGSGTELGGRVVSFRAIKEAVLGVSKCGRFHLGFPQGEDWEDMELLQRCRSG